MKTKRWLQNAINYTARNNLDMPWVLVKDRSAWADRCAKRARSI